MSIEVALQECEQIENQIEAIEHDEKRIKNAFRVFNLDMSISKDLPPIKKVSRRVLWTLQEWDASIVVAGHRCSQIHLDIGERIRRYADTVEDNRIPSSEYRWIERIRAESIEKSAEILERLQSNTIVLLDTKITVPPRTKVGTSFEHFVIVSKLSGVLFHWLNRYTIRISDLAIGSRSSGTPTKTSCMTRSRSLWNKFSIYTCQCWFNREQRFDISPLFSDRSEENIQVITDISENASKEYAIERVLEKIVQTWNELQFETTVHKNQTYKMK